MLINSELITNSENMEFQIKSTKLQSQEIQMLKFEEKSKQSEYQDTVTEL